MPNTRTPKATKLTKAKSTISPKAKTRKGKAPAKPVVEIDLDAATPAPAAGPAKTLALAPTKPLSGLDAAAQVLREAGEPLDAQTLVARILERGLWTTAGKTPSATIYSAMIREIKAKGSTSRFQKVERGRFAAAG